MILCVDAGLCDKKPVFAVAVRTCNRQVICPSTHLLSLKPDVLKFGISDPFAFLKEIAAVAIYRCWDYLTAIPLYEQLLLTVLARYILALRATTASRGNTHADLMVRWIDWKLFTFRQRLLPQGDLASSG